MESLIVAFGFSDHEGPLEQAHKMSFVLFHRDLFPSNFLIHQATDLAKTSEHSLASINFLSTKPSKNLSYLALKSVAQEGFDNGSNYVFKK